MKELVAFFRESKRIHGFCPCCGDVFRLSEVAVFTRGLPPKTPFDRIEDAQARVDAARERFAEQQVGLRDEARRRGQAVARARVNEIAPFFTKHRIDVQDVKALFDPVRYVHFRGLNGAGVRAIELIDQPARSHAHERRQASIGRAVQAGNVAWKTLRVAPDGTVRVDRP